jgi:hypothetical protein
MTSLLPAVSCDLSMLTDAVATLPARCVNPDRAAIVTRSPPFDVDPLELRLAFVPRHAGDPEHRALREALKAVCSQER